MGYHEIKVVQRWIVGCFNCPFTFTAESPGYAEHVAKQHIEEISDKDEEKNSEHIVRVTHVTLIGRQIQWAKTHQ